MIKTNDFTDRKMLLIATLFCLTTFLILVTTLNFKTFIIKYNDQYFTIKTVSSITQEELFTLANIDMTGVEITDITENPEDNITEITLFDTFSVNITVDGRTHTHQTAPTTLNEVLNELNITLNNDDIISLPTEQNLMCETDVKITRVTYEEYFETEYLDYQTVKRESSSLDFGDTRVLVSGEQGEKVIVTETKLYDGQIVSEEIVSEEILKQPVTHIIEYGTFNVNRGVTTRDGVITTSSGQQLTYSKVIEAEATAYTAENQTNKLTKSGTVVNVGTVAVDPRVIPLGSKLYITSMDGKSWIYGEAVALDIGGAVKGNIVDLYFNTERECINFGRQGAMVYVLS